MIVVLQTAWEEPSRVVLTSCTSDGGSYVEGALRVHTLLLQKIAGREKNGSQNLTDFTQTTCQRVNVLIAEWKIRANGLGLYVGNDE